MLVHVIDKVHEIIGRTVPAGGGVVSDRLIAPRPSERVLADRHQFHMREVHPVTVVDQPLGQIAENGEIGAGLTEWLDALLEELVPPFGTTVDALLLSPQGCRQNHISQLGRSSRMKSL